MTSESSAPEGELLVGIDIGGTKSAVVLGLTHRDGVRILDRIAVATDHEVGPEGMLSVLEDQVDLLVARHGIALTRIARIGISCGGPLDPVRGVVLGPPNLPGWTNVAIVERFERRFHVPARLSNDADACALAEWLWGAGKGVRSLVFLTFGTGLGAGLILDGRPFRGAHGRAGEVGHVRIADTGPSAYGKVGSLEAFSSGAGLRAHAEQLCRAEWAAGRTVAFCDDESSLLTLTVADLAVAARRGDPHAIRLFDSAGEALGRGIAFLVDVLDPELVVIGGIYTRCRDLLEATMLDAYRAEALAGAPDACPVVPAALAEAIGDYSALAVVFDRDE